MFSKLFFSAESIAAKIKIIWRFVFAQIAKNGVKQQKKSALFDLTLDAIWRRHKSIPAKMD